MPDSTGVNMGCRERAGASDGSYNGKTFAKMGLVNRRRSAAVKE